jgi:hypothetical protein
MASYDVASGMRDGPAVQVADDSACLNSGDCFILVLAATPAAPARVIVWEGGGASQAGPHYTCHQ